VTSLVRSYRLCALILGSIGVATVTAAAAL
jgi:hypothetical protein